MKALLLTLTTLLIFPIAASAQATTRITFSVDIKDAKTDASTISKIQSSAKKIIKQKCPKKTKFYSTAVSMNIGSLNNGRYTGNANYTGECKSKK